MSQPLHRKLKNFAVVPQMWDKAASDGTVPKPVASMMNQQPMGLLGSVPAAMPRSGGILSLSPAQPIDESLEEYEVPASTWAIFSGSGTNRSIQELEQRIVTRAPGLRL